jgi:cytochrome c-type biogenesis protein CcsB
MKINYKLLFSPIFTGVLFFIFAVAMAVATFIENDFGAAAARQAVYGAKWFELIFLLMIINLAGQIFIFRLYQRKKLTVMLFHLSFLVMIIGAAITRYTGYEGIMHIREGQATDKVTGDTRFMGVTVTDNSGKELYSSSSKLEITGSSLGNFYREPKINGERYSVHYSRFIPNAVETIMDSPGNDPVAAMLVTSSGMASRQLLLLSPGDIHDLNGFRIGFINDPSLDVEIGFTGEGFTMKSHNDITVSGMTTGEEGVLPAEAVHPLREMNIYTAGSVRIIPQKLSRSGRIVPVMNEDGNARTGQDAFEMEITGNGETRKVYLYNIYGGPRTFAETTIGDLNFELFYGPEVITLPFVIKLEDFVLDRYPGSTSPSGYKSNVVLIDNSNGIEEPYEIFMNNILKYEGYRFYQSSYDQDEKGTILSVNHDMAGMLVTYAGYALLILFIILSLINPSSLLWRSSAGMWRNSSKKVLTSLVVLIVSCSSLFANPSKTVIDKEKAEEFGTILVQDQKGRTKPLYSLSTDILRKINRQNSYKGLTPMQVFLGFTLDFENWQDEKIIKVSSRELRAYLGITGEYAAVNQIVEFGGSGSYKLSGLIEEVFSKPSSERDKFDKEVIKVDERVNIIVMMARGEFLKMFPLRDGTDHWGLPSEALPNAIHENDSVYLSNILPLYSAALFEGSRTGNNSQADQYLNSIIEYQRRFAGYELPSENKVKAEIFYHKSLIFEKLFPFYATTGVIMLGVLIYLIIAGKKRRNILIKGLGLLILGGFLFHTLGLGLRWYISGHSPMSNGYESMLFISWVTVLAGLIFSRNSFLTLAATAVLASLTLMVAHLSFMDPEITALVPVLQSYWLTLHVSVITASYGFFGLSAILGLIVLILYSLSGKKNLKNTLPTVDDLTVINYRSMTLGLYFLTIGTFLGAVWANESWGRYWGWDPKETWSLITMIVYAFIVHSRMIKGLNSVFSFNIMALFGFSSVMMTYFGVNYYLSGLHSYAGGDPVPVPAFVYVTVALLVTLAVVAFRSYRKIFPIERG